MTPSAPRFWITSFFLSIGRWGDATVKSIQPGASGHRKRIVDCDMDHFVQVHSQPFVTRGDEDTRDTTFLDLVQPGLSAKAGRVLYGSEICRPNPNPKFPTRLQVSKGSPALSTISPCSNIGGAATSSPLACRTVTQFFRNVDQLATEPAWPFRY